MKGLDRLRDLAVNSAVTGRPGLKIFFKFTLNFSGVDGLTYIEDGRGEKREGREKQNAECRM